MTTLSLLPYIAVMAVVTYLIRMLPLAFMRRKIKNRFLLSFLRYVPYAVLGAMTFPAILSSTGTLWSALAGLAVALLLAYREKSLLTVALAACAAALTVNLGILLLG